jgi:hypothetical protein
MKITTIKYMERKNLGNYEHQEITAEALIDETEDPSTALTTLKFWVHNSLNSKEVKFETGYVNDDGDSNNLPITAPAVKEKKPKAKKVADVQATSPTIEEAVVVEDIVSQSKEKVKATKVTKYDSNVPEHKSIFGSYLAKAYGDAWKTVAPKEDIKNFTASLNGMDFIDNDGAMVDSFMITVKGFFGA